MITIHDRALEIVRKYKKNESELIDIISEIDQSKGYREKNYTSTFQYSLGFLNLSEDIAGNLIAIARKSREVPALKKAVANNLITVSKARRILPVLNKENQEYWLGLAQTAPKAKLEKEVAKIRPQVLTPEKARYVTENRLKLELGVSESTMQDFKRAQEILAQKTKTHVNMERALELLLKDFLKREDPVVKAERILSKASRNGVIDTKTQSDGLAQNQIVLSSLPGPGRANAATKNDLAKQETQKHTVIRTPLPSIIEHQVNFRDKGQCTEVDANGERCDQKKWLHIHHVLPVSRGGQNQIQNLKTLCFTHHQMIHHKLPVGSS